MPQNLLEKAPELDHYLSTLDTELKDLSVDERAKAHTELRQHLEAMISAQEEMGMPYRDAVTESLKQFGNAKAIGHKLYVEAEQKLIPPHLQRVMIYYLVAVIVQAIVFSQLLNLQTASGILQSMALTIVVGLGMGIYIERRYPTSGLLGGILSHLSFMGLILFPLVGYYCSAIWHIPWLVSLAAMLIPTVNKAIFLINCMTIAAFFTRAWQKKKWQVAPHREMYAVLSQFGIRLKPKMSLLSER